MTTAIHGSLRPPVQWCAEALWEAIAPVVPGFTMEVLPEVDSTNSELMRRARAGQLDPTLLVAEHQTAGRGRLGRVWQDDGQPNAPSTLMFSLGMMLSPASWSGLSLAVGLSVAQTLHPDLRLKWPNDLLLEDRKLGGILIETVSPGAGVTRPASHEPHAAPGRYVVIGIGINIAARSGAGLATAPAWTTQQDPRLDAVTVLHRIAMPLVMMAKRFEHSGFAPLQPAFNALDALRSVEVTLSDGQNGTAQGVDENGALVVATPCGVVKISSSEVSVRPKGSALTPALPTQA